MVVEQDRKKSFDALGVCMWTLQGLKTGFVALLNINTWLKVFRGLECSWYRQHKSSMRVVLVPVKKTFCRVEILLPAPVALNIPGPGVDLDSPSSYPEGLCCLKPKPLHITTDHKEYRVSFGTGPLQMLELILGAACLQGLTTSR